MGCVNHVAHVSNVGHVKHVDDLGHIGTESNEEHVGIKGIGIDALEISICLI